MAALNFIDSGKLHLFQRGSWNPVAETAKIRLSDFEASAAALVSNQGKIFEKVKASQILAYVDLFNTAWTTARLAQKKIAAPPKGNVDPIQFSSFSKQYAWLSNFFPTLIFDTENRRLLHHVEAGYVAFKATIAEEMELVQDVIQEPDPAKAKTLGSHIPRPDGALDEMQRLEVLKFSQNPILRDLLRKSGEASLEEFTSDPYWGTAHGTTDDDDSNHLGRILQEVRVALS